MDVDSVPQPQAPSSAEAAAVKVTPVAKKGKKNRATDGIKATSVTAAKADSVAKKREDRRAAVKSAKEETLIPKKIQATVVSTIVQHAAANVTAAPTEAHPAETTDLTNVVDALKGFLD